MHADPRQICSHTVGSSSPHFLNSLRLYQFRGHAVFYLFFSFSLWHCSRPRENTVNTICVLFVYFYLWTRTNLAMYCLLYGRHRAMKSVMQYFRKWYHSSYRHFLPPNVVLSPYSPPETRACCWNPFPPSGGRCFPFNVEQRGQECRGRWGAAKGWGEAREKALSMRRDAQLQPTHLNYGELWWNMRDVGRAGSSNTVGRDEMTQLAGQISQIRGRGTGMDSRAQGTF